MTQRSLVLFLLVVLGAAPVAAAPVVTRNLDLLASRHDFPGGPGGLSYGSCWSYVHHDGREYAVLGTRVGTAIYNLVDPWNPRLVGFFQGPITIVREMKSYREWIYVVCDATGPGQGIQIIRMSDPDRPVLAGIYATGFVRTHTLSVDPVRALLFCNGTRTQGGWEFGMHVLSLAVPEAPVPLGRWPEGVDAVPHDLYVHDSTPAGNRLFACSLFGGMRILDTTVPALPVEIASWRYPGMFSHSAWPDKSGRYLYVADELTAEPLKVFDLADPAAPRLVNAVAGDPRAIVHNPRVRGHELYLSNYTEGVRIFDISDPVHPAEFARADSYLGTYGGYNGVWEVCPYFPSGIVIASDMQTGLHVYRPVRNYGLLQVRVVDGASGEPIAGARVGLEPAGDTLRTPADGIARFAAAPGAVTVRAGKFGYGRAILSRTIASGAADSVTIPLERIPRADVGGMLRDAWAFRPLHDGDITLAYTPLRTGSDSLGRFLLPAVPQDGYRIEVSRPGYVPRVWEGWIGPPWNPMEFDLGPAQKWDPCESPTGWIVGAPGDNARSGIWVRTVPLGTGERPIVPAPGSRASGSRGEAFAATEPGPRGLHETEIAYGSVQPGADRTPRPGTMCWVTGQGTDPQDIREADVDGGRTSLTSPPYDLSGMDLPMIGYWRWFHTDVDDGDWLAVLISNDDGATWVRVDSTRGLHNRWEERTIRVSDHVAPSSRVRVRFVAADFSAESVVEAAIDDVILYDAGGVTVGAPDATRALGGALRFGAARPNPARGAVRLALEVPRACDLAVEVLDVGGRRVRTLHRGPAGAGPLGLIWDGTDEGGRTLPAGLYFARATGGGESARAKLVRVR